MVSFDNQLINTSKKLRIAESIINFLNIAHQGMANWWALLIKVGMAAKIFVHVLRQPV